MDYLTLGALLVVVQTIGTVLAVAIVSGNGPDPD